MALPAQFATPLRHAFIRQTNSAARSKRLPCHLAIGCDQILADEQIEAKT